jgi:hypothetical protein
MATLTVDRQQLINKIVSGDNCDGNHVIVVKESLSRCEFHWSSKTAQWNSWADDDFVANVPALDPEGTGTASEDAEDFLQAVLSADEFSAAKDRYDDGMIGWVELAEELKPEEWQENRDESASNIADDFLYALNHGTSDFCEEWIWGADYDGEDYPAPKCEFEWEGK